MRLIDADALLKPIEDSYCHAGLHDESYRKIKKWIRKAKTIEVVRCKDCKHFMPYTGEEALIVPYEDTDGWCHQGYPRSMDFFCADGERRTE